MNKTSILNVILKDIQNVYIYTNNVKLCTIRMWKPVDKTSLGYQYGTVNRNVTGMGLSQNLVSEKSCRGFFKTDKNKLKKKKQNTDLKCYLTVTVNIY